MSGYNFRIYGPNALMGFGGGGGNARTDKVIQQNLQNIDLSDGYTVNMDSDKRIYRVFVYVENGAVSDSLLMRVNDLDTNIYLQEGAVALRNAYSLLGNAPMIEPMAVNTNYLIMLEIYNTINAPKLVAPISAIGYDPATNLSVSVTVESTSAIIHLMEPITTVTFIAPGLTNTTNFQLIVYAID